MVVGDRLLARVTDAYFAAHPKELRRKPHSRMSASARSTVS